MPPSSLWSCAAPGSEEAAVLVELGVVEQRYQAVLEVLQEAATVTEVALHYGVARQTVHRWLREYAAGRLAGLVDRSSRPDTCPHQMAPVVQARIVELRRAHPGWVPCTILTRLAREGVSPLHVAFGGVSGAVASRADRTDEASPPARGLQALGAGPADGALADGPRRADLPARRHRAVRVRFVVDAVAPVGG
jgi:transposase-like protein